MKTSLSALAKHYRVNYKQLRDVLANLDPSVIEIGKRGCVVHDVSALESAIAHLPRKADSSLAIEPIRVDDGDIIEAEIVEDETDADVARLSQSVGANHITLKQVAQLSAREYGKQLASVYRQALTEEVSKGVSKAHNDVLGLLGK